MFAKCQIPIDIRMFMLFPKILIGFGFNMDNPSHSVRTKRGTSRPTNNFDVVHLTQRNGYIVIEVSSQWVIDALVIHQYQDLRKRGTAHSDVGLDAKSTSVIDVDSTHILEQFIHGVDRKLGNFLLRDDCDIFSRLILFRLNSGCRNENFIQGSLSLNT